MTLPTSMTRDSSLSAAALRVGIAMRGVRALMRAGSAPESRYDSQESRSARIGVTDIHFGALPRDIGVDKTDDLPTTIERTPRSSRRHAP
jgi:hypothetical protein